MAIALFPFGGLFAPLHALMNGFPRRAPRTRKAVPAAALQQSTGTAVSAASVRPARPLRVVRVFEGAQPRAAAGRMVISGRLADVCAELDRLAAAEAAAG
jgi:hypothetical protein